MHQRHTKNRQTEKHRETKKTDTCRNWFFLTSSSSEPQATELLGHFFTTLISTLPCTKDNKHLQHLRLEQGSLCPRENILWVDGLLRRESATDTLMGIFSHNTARQLSAHEPIQTQVISHSITGYPRMEPFSLPLSWGTPWTCTFTQRCTQATNLLAAQPLGRKTNRQHSPRWEPGWVHPTCCQIGTNTPPRCRLAVLEPHTHTALLCIFFFSWTEQGLLANLGLHRWTWPPLCLSAERTREAAQEQPHMWTSLFTLAQISHTRPVLTSCSHQHVSASPAFSRKNLSNLDITTVNHFRSSLQSLTSYLQCAFQTHHSQKRSKNWNTWVT